MRPTTLYRHLVEALDECNLSDLTWYQATRHTFASQWVLGGGSIEKLATIMGHSSVVVTERYAHLRPDLFGEGDYSALEVDLMARGKVVRLVPEQVDENGCTVVTDEISDREKRNKRA